MNQKKRLHLNASLSQYLLKEWQGVYPTSLLTGILHLLHLPIIRHLAFMIKCTNRKTTDEPPWLLESNGRATAGCWRRKGQLAWGRGEDHHISIEIVQWNLSLKVGRGRGRKRKASSASPPPPPPPPLQPLQNDFAHGAISHSTHQDRYVQKYTMYKMRWFWGLQQSFNKGPTRELNDQTIYKSTMYKHPNQQQIPDRTLSTLV